MEYKPNYIEPKEQQLTDFIKVENGNLILLAPIKTQNFLKNKRGVEIKQSGINATGGSIGVQATISGTLTHTGSAAGFNGATPVAKANNTALTDSTTGSATSTINNVGAAFSQATLNNNFASLTAEVNALRTILVNLGFIN